LDSICEAGETKHHPSDLLKLFIDGYLNRMCSSRTLEKDGRNIELMWQGRLSTDHNTLPILERQSKAISRFFITTVKLASLNFRRGVAGGGDAKLRAKTPRKNNFNLNKTERHIAHRC
jgi:hypothetical protein